MTATEIRNSIVEGQNFSFSSFRKKSRLYTISVIARPIEHGGNLFSIKGSDLKNPAGLYNMNTIIPIIEAAINGKQQNNFRIR